jgi:hypothetical protein
MNEPLKKKLKTIGISKEEQSEDTAETPQETIEEDENASLYQHIHEAKESQHDTQTIDAATKVRSRK